MAKPITPSEVVAAKQSSMPDEVLEAFNEMIAEKWDGHSAGFKQDDVLKLVMSKLNGRGVARVTRDQVFDRHWMDVEPIYRKAGWDVEYDKPGYCEDYAATFKFSKKSR